MILLTGATGYLGSRIALELVARRMPFRVLVRDATRLPFDASAGACEIVTGSLTEEHSVRSALKGADAVIHSAALVKMYVRDRGEFWHTNVRGLMQLLREASGAGVQRVVYTSSFLALGPSADVNANESLVHRGPYSDEYERSKARALAWLRHEGRGFPVVTLFPGVIYGPGPKTEANLVGGMIDQYLAGKFPGIVGNGKQRWSFAYIKDVVDAHLTALEKGKPGEEYVLGGDNRSLNNFFQLLTSVSGVKHPVLHIPFWIARLAGTVEIFRAQYLSHTPQLTPGVVDVFKHDWVYSSAKAERELGYHVTPLEEGLQKTIESLVH